jgi:hypothetical protein
MPLKLKTFPLLLLVVIFFSWSSKSCRQEHPQVIGPKQFIEIYARLLIIDEMDLTPEYKELLRQELMQKYKITRTDIDQTITYYNSQPEKWVEILAKTRDRIEQIRTAKLTQPKR